MARSPNSRRLALYSLGLIVFLFAVRLPYLLQAPLNSDSDLSVVGLMAAHIAQGKHFPVFMYGQGYMGAGEAYLAALFFKLFGRSLAVQSAASLTVFALFAWLGAALVRRHGKAGEGLAVLFLTALAPPAMAWWFSSGFGGYCAVLALGTAAIFIWTGLVDGKTEKRWPLPAAGVIVVAAGLWTYTVFWLFILPPLGLSVLAFGTVVREVWRAHPRDERRRRLRLTALAILGLGLIDLVHALAVGLGALSYRWIVGGIHLISPSPETALGAFLARSLVLILAGLLLLVWQRVGRSGLGLIWRKARPHLIWLLICLAGTVLAKLIYLFGAWAMADYAPFRIWPELGFNDWTGIGKRWGWFGRDFVRNAFGLRIPGVGVWAAWVLFAPVPLALILTAYEAGKAVWQGEWTRWLSRNRLAFLYSVSTAGLIGAMLFTRATVDEVGYRYLLLVIAWWPYLLIRLYGRLMRFSKPLGAVFIAVPVLLLLLSAGANLGRPGAWRFVPDRARYASLEELMGRAGLRYGRADYWVAYNVTNLTHERLIVTPGREFKTTLVRYLPYDEAVAQAGRKAYIFRRAYDWRDLERIKAEFLARRRNFSWIENRDWICLVVSRQKESGK